MARRCDDRAEHRAGQETAAHLLVADALCGLAEQPMCLAQGLVGSVRVPHSPPRLGNRGMRAGLEREESVLAGQRGGRPAQLDRLLQSPPAQRCPVAGQRGAHFGAGVKPGRVGLGPFFELVVDGIEAVFVGRSRAPLHLDDEQPEAELPVVEVLLANLAQQLRDPARIGLRALRERFGQGDLEVPQQTGLDPGSETVDRRGQFLGGARGATDAQQRLAAVHSGNQVRVAIAQIECGPLHLVGDAQRFVVPARRDQRLGQVPEQQQALQVQIVRLDVAQRPPVPLQRLVGVSEPPLDQTLEVQGPCGQLVIRQAVRQLEHPVQMIL